MVLITTGKKQINWGKNQSWNPQKEAVPKNKDELQTLLSSNTGKIRACGSLHSFSDCAKTEGTMIHMNHLNQVLEVNKEEKQIKVEAGIILSDLYQILRQYNWAIYGVPNIADITLGGAICNCTHGTGIETGTICDSVVKMEAITAEGELIAVSRATNSNEEAALFEALLVGGGFFTVLFSITLQCVDSYKSFVINQLFLREELPKKLSELLISYNSANLQYNPGFNVFDLKARMKIANQPFAQSGDQFLKREKFFSDITRQLLKNKFISRRLILPTGQFLLKIKPIRHLLNWQMILDWDRAELIKRRSRFANIEYAIPINVTDKLFEALLELIKNYEKKGYKRIQNLVMRPVKADRAGFLSPTKNRDTCFFDFSRQNHTDIEDCFFKEAEEIFLSFGGRVSWSRQFFAGSKQISANYPDFQTYVNVMKKIDPYKKFSNAFIERLFHD